MLQSRRERRSRRQRKKMRKKKRYCGAAAKKCAGAICCSGEGGGGKGRGAEKMSYYCGATKKCAAGKQGRGKVHYCGGEECRTTGTEHPAAVEVTAQERKKIIQTLRDSRRRSVLPVTAGVRIRGRLLLTPKLKRVRNLPKLLARAPEEKGEEMQ